MKEMLGNLAEGQIEFYKTVCSSFYHAYHFLTSPHHSFQAMEEWDRIIPIIQRIRVDI
jgi:sorting nexin-4